MTAKRNRPTPTNSGTAEELNNSEAQPIAQVSGTVPTGPERFRGFKITQNLHHPVTGEVLMTPVQLQIGLDHRSITKWAWIEHDMDVHNDGSSVAPHVHVAVQCENARSREQIASWFDVPVDLVKPLVGRGAFISYVRYLTHEDPNQHALGKHRYPDMRVVADFDWRSEVDAHFAKSLKLSTRLDDVKLGVLNGDLALWEVREADPLLYANHIITLKRLAEDCRMAHIEAGRTTPDHLDMKLRVSTGITLTAALTWIADQCGFDGNKYDRLLQASSVVLGKEGVGVAA
jgi:hypothetical protein